VFVSLRAEGEDHKTLCTKHDEIKGPAVHPRRAFVVR
jgi:hypothetical protein